MRHWLLASAALLAAYTVPGPAKADVVTLGASGMGINITMTLTYSPTSPQGPLGTVPNTNYPVGSFVVTGITGTFSDMNTPTPIVNAAITGMVPLTFEGSRDVPPDPPNLLAPPSLSFIEHSGGALSFDNLFFPGGSPVSASDWPSSGGVFDIYGLGFTVAGGYTVNLWSDGYDPDFSPFGPKLTGLQYGAAVVAQDTFAPGSVPQGNVAPGVIVDYQLFGLSVPEPASLLMLGTGLLGLAAARRRSRG